jgi:hypothetical protein
MCREMEEMVCENLYKVGNLHVEDFTSRERDVHGLFIHKTAWIIKLD